MAKKIYDFNLGYTLLRPYVCWCFRFFYSALRVEGKENLPKGKPYILAPNHQNALMDALVVLATNRKRTVFLARSDIFKSPIFAAILRFLKIMPIYRIRDGRGELGKNEEVFEDSADVLHAGYSLCLMPEGQQSFKRKLLPLVKGTFRIAFLTQESLSDEDLLIIPVGIDYGDYVNEGSHLTIRYGTPINVRQHMADYEEQPARALKTMQEELSVGIDSLIQNIRSEEYYELFYRLSLMFCSAIAGKGGYFARLDARRTITNVLNEMEQTDAERVGQLQRLTDEYTGVLKKHKLTDEVVRKNGIPVALLAMQSIVLLLCFPFTAVAWLLNTVPAYVPRIFTRKFKNKEFVASVNVVGYLAVLFILMLALFIVSIFIVVPLWIAPVLLFVTPVLRRGIYAYSRYCKKLVKGIRFAATAKQARQSIIGLRQQIAQLLGR